ncbi:hypothetical protein ACH35V_01935 [Actinomadura sp. 1N219]|uniref:hypothetical protein n=1 Tax=Actinomadura sp. 1N219 TaxID=3375152 RepID=UPI00378D6767
MYLYVHENTHNPTHLNPPTSLAPPALVEQTGRPTQQRCALTANITTGPATANTLADYQGALVAVTHDRRMRSRFTGSHLELRNGRITTHQASP